MNMNEDSRAQASDSDDAPDLSKDGWPDKFANATVRRGRLPVAGPEASATKRR